MTTFRIAVDAHWLVCWPNSGISTYLQGLLNGWAHSPENLHVDLLAPFRPASPRGDVFLSDPRFQFVYPPRRLNPIASYRAQLYWQQVAIPRLVRSKRPDVYLSPFHLTPLTLPGIKVVSTIHDLCFLAEPRFSRAYWLHSAQLWTACLRATRLICISHATHRALKDWSPTFGSKAIVVHNGFEGQSISEATARATISRLDASLIPRQYLLWVGYPSERKNLQLLFEIFQMHHRRFPTHHFVVVTGKQFHDQIRALARQAGIEPVLRVWAADDTMRNALYCCALAFVFPSTCEGFGYPALEAMAQGCPTIALRGTAMQEFLEGIIPLAPEPTAAAFIEALSTLFTHSETQQAGLQKKLIDRAGQFSSPVMAGKTLEILREASASNNLKAR